MKKPTPELPRGGRGVGLLRRFVVFAANEDDTAEVITEIWAHDYAGAKQRARQLFPDAADVYVMP